MLAKSKDIAITQAVSGYLATSRASTYKGGILGGIYPGTCHNPLVSRSVVLRATAPKIVSPGLKNQ